VTMLVLAWIGLVLASIPAFLTWTNLPLFRRAPPRDPNAPWPSVSVLVPARNEETTIGRLLAELRASDAVDLEVVVLDDASEDRTAEIVATTAAQDPRVRLVHGGPLPTGWCGKQHACWQLAAAARHATWIFCDVDVRPTTDAVARSVAALDVADAALISGFPRQRTGSFLEWLLLPLIHFVLLGFLPLARARQVASPSLAAGCGQWFVTRRADYERAGGHAAIRASLHDGVKLPRAYRRAGLRTDIFDATDIASCRMYDTSHAVWQGLSKNATEGVGSRAMILPFTLLLGGGQVLPFAVFSQGLITRFSGWPTGAAAVSGLAVGLAYLPRFLDAHRFGQSFSSAAAHPLGITVFLAIQWVALARKSLGLRTTWRGRALDPQ